MDRPLTTATRAHHDLARNWYVTALAEHNRSPLVVDGMPQPPQSLFAWGWFLGHDHPVIESKLRPIGPGGTPAAIARAARILIRYIGCDVAIVSTAMFCADTATNRGRRWTDPDMVGGFAQYPFGPVGRALTTWGVNTAGDLQRCSTWITPAGGYDLDRPVAAVQAADTIGAELAEAGVGQAKLMSDGLRDQFGEATLSWTQQRALSLIAGGILLEAAFKGAVRATFMPAPGGRDEPVPVAWLDGAQHTVRSWLGENFRNYL